MPSLATGLSICSSAVLAMGAAAPITRISSPSFGPYIEGEVPPDRYTPGVYQSNVTGFSAVIDQVIWYINGVVWDGATPLAALDEVELEEVVVLVADGVASEATWGGVAATWGGAPATWGSI